MATQVEGGATGSQLSIWLKANKLEDIVQPLSDAGLEYEDILGADEDDLKEIFTQEKIPRKYLLRLKSALKKIPTSSLAQTSQPKRQSVVVLSSSQNDFILNVYSKKEKILKNASKIQDRIQTLSTSSDDIKKQVDKQYGDLIKLLEKRKEFIVNSVDNVITNQVKSLNEQLSSVTNAKRLTEQIENDINQCLSSKQTQITEIQAQMNKIINTAQAQLESMEEFMDENMPISVRSTCEYKCNQTLFENLIASDLDYIVYGCIRFSSQPIFERNKQIITFKVKYGKDVNTKHYTVEGRYIGDVEDDEKKESDENNADNWILFGEFNLSHNETQNEEEIIVSADKKEIKDGIYNVRISSDGGVRSLANSTIRVLQREQWCWNDADKDDYIILSNNNLTVTHKCHRVINHLIRGNVGYSTGVHSFRIRVDVYNRGGSGSNLIGFATSDVPRQSDWELKQQPNFWGFYAVNLKAPDNVKGTTQRLITVQIKSGDVVTVTLDTENRKLSCYLASKKVSEITDIVWNGQDALYPALYVGALHPNTYTLLHP